MNGRFGTAASILALATLSCGAQITVPLAPQASAKPYNFKDERFHVRFLVPPGWQFTTKDGEVSAFHADVVSAPPESYVRAVASLNFNPYPRSTLSGAMFYFSVDKSSSEQACARQAKPPSGTQQIGGMQFAHGHDEQGDICTEARDDVYTAYRKHSCLRFDLEIHTFCAVSSGAQEITGDQLEDIEQRMTNILSTVDLGWEKSGPNLVPVPPPPAPLMGPAAPGPVAPRDPPSSPPVATVPASW